MAKLVNLVETSLVTENVGGSGSCGEGMLVRRGVGKPCSALLEALWRRQRFIINWVA